MSGYWNRRPASYSSRDPKHPFRPLVILLAVAGALFVLAVIAGWL